MVNSFDFLFISPTNDLLERFRKACDAKGWSFGCAANLDEAFRCVSQNRYGNILLDAHLSEPGGLSFFEWLMTRGITLGLGLFSQDLESFKALPFERIPFADHFVLSRDQDWLIQKLSFLACAHKSRCTTLHCECTDSQGQRLTWIELGSEMLNALSYARALENEAYAFLITGDVGVGKRLLASVMTINSHETFVCNAQGTDGPEQCRRLAERLRVFWRGSVGDSNTTPLTVIIHGFEVLSQELQDIFENYFTTGDKELQEANGPSVMHLIMISQKSYEELLRSSPLRRDFLTRFAHNQVHLRPLSERRQDITPLIDFFIQEWERDHPLRFLSDDALLALTKHDWPGNIAELKDTVEAILSQSAETTVTARALPSGILEKVFYRTDVEHDDFSDLSYREAKKRMLHKFHRAYISDLIQKSQNNLTVAAEKAGIDRSNFKKILKKYDLL